MKKLFIYPAKLQRSGTLLLLSLSLSAVKADYWTQKADFGGTARADATGLSIGTKGYIGTGFTSTYTTDWWEYDPVTNTWTQKADYGGSPIVESSSFAIGNFGYILSSPSGLDFWQFDPALNTWTQMANFAGAVRQAAVAFAINGKGYITTGLGGASLDDIWEYDPLLNSWTQKTSQPAIARHYAAGFSIGDKGYVGTGQSGAAIGLNDFWEWDQPTDTWTQKANFPGAPRREASAFTIGNYGYLGLGSGIGVYYDDFYKYDPLNNTWTPIANFGGVGREEASQFSIGNLGYVGTGYDGVAAGVSRKDFWEYHPEDSTTSINEPAMYNVQFTISPNPAKEFIVVSLPRIYRGYPLNGKEKLEITITDAQGKKVYESKLQPSSGGTNFKLLTSNFTKGIYFVEISDACLPDRQGKQKAVKKFVKE